MGVEISNERPISNMDQYNTSMTKSMIDKMFFMDKLEDHIDVIVDYGCADGALILFLAPLFPGVDFIGYDFDKAMIEKAEQKKSEKGYTNVWFASSLEELDALDIDYDNAALNLSSLIHEVYSYDTPEQIKEFWEFVNHRGFKHIVIRDMCIDRNSQRPSLKEDLLKVKSHSPNNQIHDFESHWGSLSDNRNLIHYLMKYRYVDNWAREVAENYFPLTVEQIAGQISSEYRLDYFDHYVLPFLARTVKRDFDIELKDYTHIKMIYTRR